MLGFLPPVVRGVIAFLLLVINTLFWCSLVFLLALVKLVLPFAAVRVRIVPVLNAGATAWINSAPLSTQSLRGKLVLLEFWTR